MKTSGNVIEPFYFCAHSFQSSGPLDVNIESAILDVVSDQACMRGGFIYISETSLEGWPFPTRFGPLCNEPFNNLISMKRLQPITGPPGGHVTIIMYVYGTHRTHFKYTVSTSTSFAILNPCQIYPGKKPSENIYIHFTSTKISVTHGTEYEGVPLLRNIILVMDKSGYSDIKFQTIPSMEKIPYIVCNFIYEKSGLTWDSQFCCPH